MTEGKPHLVRPRWLSLSLALLAGLQGAALATPAQFSKATFAGGCFWCMDAEFRKVSGVTSVVSGFTGGHTPNPTYEEVSSGTTGHAEAVEVTFDSGRVSYEELVRIFWKNIDPLAVNGQFCDHGSQYRTAVFFHDDSQREVAERTKREVEQHLKASVPTEIVKATTFYRAPEGHQRYAERNPQRYARYHEARKDCGRSGLLDEIWAPLPEGGNGQSKEEP